FLLLMYAIRSRSLRPSEARLRYLSPREAQQREGLSSEALLKRSPTGTALLGRLLDRTGRAARWTFQLERADMKIRASEYFLMRLMFAAVGVVIIGAWGRNAIALLIGLVVGAMLYQLPAYWVSFRTKRRVAKINAQLVETITLIAGALRSGFAFSQGVDVAAKRIGAPMSTELPHASRCEPGIEHGDRAGEHE